MYISTLSCRKELYTTSSSDKLSFSADTLSFDTVFTTVGSSIGFVKVYNPHNMSIRITSVYLQPTSFFHLNINGVAGNTASSIDIHPHDSIYIFVNVKIDPTQANTPFIIYDSIQFLTNGNHQRVILKAYGQNAHFINGVIPCNAVWANDKPYVLSSNVQVDSNCTLTINGGCHIYAHAGVFMTVYGTLNVAGLIDTAHHVYFKGDRLESYYDEVPGQWGGIVFMRGSKNNNINYAVIDEATQSIVAGIPAGASPSPTAYADNTNVPDVTINHTMIKNSYTNAILAINSKITAQSSLVYSTGSNAISLGLGGTYNFNGCTLANYNSVTSNHQDPTLSFSDYLAYQDPTTSITTIYTNTLNATFANTIVYGDISTNNEVSRDSVLSAGVQFNYSFANCLLRTTQAAPPSNFTNCILNTDPLFINVQNSDYKIAASSPCVGKANTSIPADDIMGKTRTSPADIGAYQH